MRRRSDHQCRGRAHAGAAAARKRLWLRAAVCATAVSAVLTGCSGTKPARSTRLADADLTQAVLDLRQQLADSRFLAERTDDSPEARLVLRRVENISTDRIPVAEQWSLAARVIGDPGLQELFRGKHIVVQLPPEKVELLERGGLDFPDLQPESWPTHLLTSQIASGTRAGSLTGGRDADIRKEYYLISFDIEDLQERTLLWQGSAELAREALGSVVD